MAGYYLIIYLFGGRQMQLQNRKYYIAIDTVEAWGDVPSTARELALVSRGLVTTAGHPKKLAKLLTRDVDEASENSSEDGQ